jgi:hypothetical protein
MLKIDTERYRSGHNGADSKSVWEQSHMGSNPILSAKQSCGFPFLREIAFLLFGARSLHGQERTGFAVSSGKASVIPTVLCASGNFNPVIMACAEEILELKSK